LESHIDTLQRYGGTASNTSALRTATNVGAEAGIQKELQVA
jgi:uncharacterized protein